MAETFEERLEEVYQAGGDRDKLDWAYAKWAHGYDQDLWASGNPYIAVIAGLLARHLPDRGARILDGGCGTGNVGLILHLLGYANIVGLDASDAMLAIARTKGCYRELHQKLLGGTIELPPESFDAITAAGVLTQGHAPAESLNGLVRLARPGAPIIFSISEVAENEAGFGDKMRDLERSGAWTLTERSNQFRTFPFSEQYEDLRHWVCVYRKAG